MKKTLLQLVQGILNSLDGQEVNSISDTVESLQIADFVRASYEELCASTNLPRQTALCQLTNSGNPMLPAVMYKPDNIQNIEWIKYNTNSTNNPTGGFQDVQYMELFDFMTMMFNRVSQPGIQTGTFSYAGVTSQLFWMNDKAPSYYTVMNDNAFIFDSYDASVETTLTSTRTSCLGEFTQSISMTDSWVPNLSDKQFVLLENMAKAQAFVEQKQTQNPTAEKRARNGMIRTQRDKISAPYNQNAATTTGVDYGRSGTRTGISRLLRSGQ